MDGQELRRRLADDAATDEGLEVAAADRRHVHGHRLRGGQPVGVVVARCHVAHVVDVTEEEGHSAETPQAAARLTCK